MIYTLPYTVDIKYKDENGDEHYIKIRNNGDFRVALDVIEALNDKELTQQEQIQCALFIFYGEELEKITDYERAAQLMVAFINGGQEDTEESTKPSVMDWKHDFAQIAPPISRTLGYDPRLPDKFTHWWTFLGAYMEIGECTFSNIVSIRSKRMKGKKLEKWEEEFYRENRKMIDLPYNLSPEDEDFLNFDI
jgi:hypothetical protein